MSEPRHSVAHEPRLLLEKPMMLHSLPRLGREVSFPIRQRRAGGTRRQPRWAIGKRRIASPNSHPATEATNALFAFTPACYRTDDCSCRLRTSSDAAFAGDRFEHRTGERWHGRGYL